MLPVLASVLALLQSQSAASSESRSMVYCEVEGDDDWTRTVTTTPTSTPAIGLWKMSELRKIIPAWRPATRRRPRMNSFATEKNWALTPSSSG